MKVFIFTLFLAVTVLAQDHYEEVNTNFNVAEVLENDRLLNAYVKCLLNKGPCTPEVKTLKEKLPEALETRCARCTEKQKQMGKQLAQGIQKKHPDIWQQLVETYDPQGKYQQAWQDFLKE